MRFPSPFSSYTFLIARRYLAPSRRNRFISFITAISVLGVMFGVTALLVSLAILDGFDQTLRSNMVAFVGHIEVSSFGNRPIRNYQKTVATLPERVPEVTRISPFVSREAIIRSGSGLEGVVLKGIIPGVDVSSIRDRMVAGSFSFPRLDSAQLGRLLLGERLTQKLKVKMGDTVVIFAPNGVPSPDNPPTIQQFVISGIYRTGMAEYDDVYTYTSLDQAQHLFEYPSDQVSGYDILVKDINKANEVARKLDTALGFPHYPRTLFDIFEQVFAWLDLQREPIPIVLGLIIIVAVFNIASTLLMVVLEKTESIGVLSTLGARPTGIMKIFVGQGLLIGGVGTMLGVILSLAFTLIQMHYKPLKLDADIYFIDAVPVALTYWHYLLVISISLILSVVFTVIPALIAALVRPVRALRFR
ncbi:MAG: Lipoprotein-releasing system permease protein [Chlorobi bacterium]|nr:Lipoprotein-releasing system permease protein [Chlorobiota bacterium]